MQSFVVQSMNVQDRCEKRIDCLLATEDDGE